MVQVREPLSSSRPEAAVAAAVSISTPGKFGKRVSGADKSVFLALQLFSAPIGLREARNFAEHSAITQRFESFPRLSEFHIFIQIFL